MADKRLKRRDFIKGAALGTAAFMIQPTARVLGANDRVRVGVIGFGARAKELVTQLRALPNADLVAVADGRPMLVSAAPLSGYSSTGAAARRSYRRHSDRFARPTSEYSRRWESRFV